MLVRLKAMLVSLASYIYGKIQLTTVIIQAEYELK